MVSKVKYPQMALIQLGVLAQSSAHWPRYCSSIWLGHDIPQPPYSLAGVDQTVWGDQTTIHQGQSREFFNHQPHCGEARWSIDAAWHHGFTRPQRCWLYDVVSRQHTELQPIRAHHTGCPLQLGGSDQCNRGFLLSGTVWSDSALPSQHWWPITARPMVHWSPHHSPQHMDDGTVCRRFRWMDFC